METGSDSLFVCSQNPVSAVHWSPADKNLVVSGDEKGVVVLHWFHTGDTSSFFPEPRSIFCLSCSPHSWELVAVGWEQNSQILSFQFRFKGLPAANKNLVDPAAGTKTG